MTKDEINAFIHPFKPDIRQSTLQLQYVLSTGEIDPVIFIKTKYSNLICFFINLFKICIQKVLNRQYQMSLNSIWWNWPHMFGCHSTSIKDSKQTKCNIDISTISQNLDIMSELNLIYSKTQVCSLNFRTNQMFLKIFYDFMCFRATIS